MRRPALLLCLMLISPLARALDPHSYANSDALRTASLALDLTVDFASRTLSGTAEHQLQRLDPNARQFVLDSRDLKILGSEAQSPSGQWQRCDWQLKKSDAVLGQALVLYLPPKATAVRVHYRTKPQASGLQWLPAKATAGKRQPFLFSQSQAIHARSWVPVQDSPGLRIAYSARIHVPAGVRPVMGAQNPSAPDADGSWHFAMEERIPPYLMALAVGDLAFAPTGTRSGIYAEPSVLPAAVKEFEDTERMIEKAEALYGPYRWGRYDLLILPPSFPFGGMENPRLTFASPTVIAGDKSLVALVAHELAHSWSGNLVTNATWRDFWLNEGFTSYFTNRIMEAVYGTERGNLERTLEAEELQRDFAEVPAEKRMMAATDARKDPEDYSSIVAYNRGSLMLYNLERHFGRARFDAFLTAWFTEHAFTSQTTETFLAFLNTRLLANSDFDPATIEQWVYAEHWPRDAVWPQSTQLTAVSNSREAWLKGLLPAPDLAALGYGPLEWTLFLDGMPNTVSAAQLRALDAAIGFSQKANAYVLRAWLPLAIRHGLLDDPQVTAAVQKHLLGVGRRWLINSTWQAYAEADPKAAKALFAKASAGMHPITRATVAKLVAGGRKSP